MLATLGLAGNVGGWTCELKVGRGGVRSAIFVCGRVLAEIFAWRPGRGGAHKVLVRPRGFPPRNLRLRLASSDGRVQAVRLSYREPGGAQEGSDTSPSHPATVPSPVPALPSWPGSRLTALRVGILALVHHKPAPCFPPNLRLQTPHHCAGLTWPGSEEKRLRGRSWGFAHLPPVPSNPV